MRNVAQRGAPPNKHSPLTREREMYRLRVEECRSLRGIGERFGISEERVRQLLAAHFGLRGSPHGDRKKRALVALGEACRQLREQQGLSVAQVATSARVAVDCLSALEAGQLDPDLSLLKSFASSIGVPLSAIVARAEELER